MEKISVIHNIAELETFAKTFLSKLSRKEGSTKATIVGLRGELGAGKTAFTKAVAKTFGIDINITSPTFVILKNYPLPKSEINKNFSHLVHIDAYRLKGGNELTTLGWQEVLADKSNLIMIEWPEIVADVMPAETIYLDFKHIDENTREIHEK